MPKFNVVIPTCHRNADLAKCLDRLVPGAQTLSSEYYSVIVSDDGLTDTAENMVRERFPWAVWTQGPRRGPAANRNYGARQATGEWLIFTDDDCVPDSEWLAAYAAAATPEASVLEGKTDPCGIKDRLDMECPINQRGGYLWSCNFALKRALFEEIGGFDENFSGAAMEDVDMRERLKSAGHGPIFVAAALVRHPWRLRRGRAHVRLHALSTLHFLKKHPQEATRYRISQLMKNQFCRTIRGIKEAALVTGFRGVFRQNFLDIYWHWCMWRAFETLKK